MKSSQRNNSLPVFDLDELAEYVFPHIIDLCEADLETREHAAVNRIGIAAMHEAIRILDLARRTVPLSQIITKESSEPDEKPIEQKFAEEFPRIDALFQEAAGRVPRQERKKKNYETKVSNKGNKDTGTQTGN